MLSSMHKTATGFFAKALMIFLIGIFAVWGIGDIFRSSSSNTIVKVGDTHITATDFQREFSKQKATYRRMLGENYNPEMLKQLGVPQQVTTQLVQAQLLKNEAASLGMNVPDTHLFAEIRKNPSFKGEDGRFDGALFQRIVQNNGLGEKEYTSLLAQETATRQLLDAVLGGVSVPDTAVHLRYQHDFESRKADAIILPAELIKDIPEPSEKSIKAYYNEHKDSYAAPAYVTFSYVAIEPKTLAKQIVIPEEKLLEEYQQRVGEFTSPEKREVKQLLFASKEDAVKARAAMDKGTAFDKAGKDFGATNSELSLGEVAEADIIPEAKKDVFALKEGGITQPVQSSFGWHLFTVTAIKPSHVMTFEEVRVRLTEEMQSARALEEAYQLSDNLQNELGGGTSMEDVAKSLELKVLTVGPIDGNGHQPDGTAVILPDNLAELPKKAFELADGETSSINETADGTYYAVRVDKLLPAQPKPLELVKTDVIAGVRQNEAAARLTKIAETAAAELDKGDVTALAAKSGGKLLTAQTLARKATHLDGNLLPAEFTKELFSLKPGEATDAYQLKNGGYAIAKLKQIVPAPQNEKLKGEEEKIRAELKAQYQEELFSGYLQYLTVKQGISPINEPLINQAMQ